MLLICYGTRPEWIKVKPIIKDLKKSKVPFKTLFTGQHKDLVSMSADFNLPTIEEHEGNRLDNIIKGIFEHISEPLSRVTHVLVQGDTTSVLAIALAAFHRHIKVIHLEAGLRTYNKDPWPEEFNRRAVSKLASIHLCPTENNKKNLINEKAPGDIYVVGNTVLDNLKKVKTSYGKKVLVTLHRRENHLEIGEWFQTISKLAKDNPELEFLLPIHPNPQVYKFKDLLKGVQVIKPIPYDQMINLIGECRFIISDSGGIQEEASFLNKKVIVCRAVTERPESVGIHSFLCDSPSQLEDMFYDINDNYEISEPCPYGDGHAAKRITTILKNVKL